MKYRWGGKEKLLAIGVYPDVTLAEEREERDKARSQLRKGLDPSAVKRAEKLKQRVAGAESFEAVAREWLSKQEAKLSPATYDKAVWTLEQLLFPWLGKQPVSKITPADLLATLRLTESRGKHETAHRAKQRASQVFRYAIATGRAERDPAADLRGALHSVVLRKRAAVTESAKVAELLKAIDCYSGNLVTCSALKLAPLLFVRTGELRHAEWSEIDLEAAEWRIPASKMKMPEEYIVPLSYQAVATLQELQPLTSRGRYVFPSVRSSTRPTSENTITAALRSMGYDGQTMTAHGFRALASTRLRSPCAARVLRTENRALAPPFLFFAFRTILVAVDTEIALGKLVRLLCSQRKVNKASVVGAERDTATVCSCSAAVCALRPISGALHIANKVVDVLSADRTIDLVIAPADSAGSVHEVLVMAEVCVTHQSSTCVTCESPPTMTKV